MARVSASPPTGIGDATRQARSVLLANAARARLLGRDPGSGALREIDAYVHPGSRLKAGALGHDRPGVGARGSQRTPFEPPTDPAQRERQHFAHEVARHLETLAAAGHLPPWALLASSPFLGQLLGALGPAARAQLVMHDDHDLSALTLPVLEPRLRVLLPPLRPA